MQILSETTDILQLPFCPKEVSFSRKGNSHYVLRILQHSLDQKRPLRQQQQQSGGCYSKSVTLEITALK